MKLFIVMALTLCSILSYGSQNQRARQASQLSASEQLAGAKRASDATIQALVQQINALKGNAVTQTRQNLNAHFTDSFTIQNPSRRWCDDDNSNVSCVKHCAARYSTGECYSYGQDFCAKDASCAANCLARYSTGQCYSYGDDKCGSNVSCSPNCLARYSTGECYSYGSDICY